MSGRVLGAGVIKTNETLSLFPKAFQPEVGACGSHRASEGLRLGKTCH